MASIASVSVSMLGIAQQQLYAGNPAYLLQAYDALRAPLLFPQLYPKCGRINHVPSPPGADLAHYGRAQGGEDVILYEKFFKDYKKPGVFLEIGALDGELYSNTWAYEKALGWKGILVEAQPTNGAELRLAIRTRSAIFTSGACKIPDLASPGSLRFSKLRGAVAADLDNSPESFIKQWGVAGEGEVRVPCIPLQFMIDATGLWDIDLFSLDVEGSERIVLETVNLSKTNVKVFCIEQDEHDPAKNEWIRQHLVAHGFEFLGSEFMVNNRNNEVFLNPRFEEIKARRPPLPIACEAM